MEKFRTSKLIAVESWNVLKQDKEILWFPIISSVLSFGLTLVMLSFFFFYTFAGSLENVRNYKTVEFEAIEGIVFGVYYVLAFFIVNFFQSAIFVVANGRFNGQDLTFSQGISEAIKSSEKIFIWSLISATVGLILNFISNKLKNIGKIVSFFLGAAWSVLTYFSLPSLVIGKTGVIDSFKESASIIRKTWGEAAILNFSTSLFFIFVRVVIFLVYNVLIIVFPKLIVLASIVFVLSIVLTTTISSTLTAIFKLALYQYARTGNIPQGFTPELIINSFQAK